MATGFLVNLGTDKSAWTGDAVAGAAVTFTPASPTGFPTASATIGGASWRITGTLADGTTVTNQIMGGVFQTDAAGNLYFISDDAVASVSSAVVDTSPIYNNTPVANGTANADNLPGTANPDVISGGGGNDTISGNSTTIAGDRDVLYGGAGNDAIYSGSGNDRLIGGAGSDYLQGDDGTDIADYSAATSGINIRLPSGGFGHGFLTDAQTGGMGADTILGIDGIIGSALMTRSSVITSTASTRMAASTPTISTVGPATILSTGWKEAISCSAVPAMIPSLAASATIHRTVSAPAKRLIMTIRSLVAQATTGFMETTPRATAPLAATI